jgi:VCBS repeat-containing protein
MTTLVRLVRASFVALGAIAVFAVCDDLPTGPSTSDVVRPPQPMLNTAGGGSATLVAAGDIAVCNTTNAATLNDEETAKLIRAIPEATVATLGDHVNVNSGAFVSAADFANCYGASWGTADILSRTHPVPGNQDWNAPAGSTPGQVYFDYFNGAGVVDGPAGRRGQGYYAYDVGSWRVVALNNNVSTAVNSPQYLWLKEELAAHPAQCTIAYWHAPLFFSAGQTIRTAVQPLWDLLYAAGAEIILNSDNKFYERFAPQTPDGSVDPDFGIREFIVGTGGQGISTPLSPPRVNSERVISPTFGILKLTLHENGYDWNFVTIPSRPLAEPETGSGTCHGSPFPTARPNGPYVSEKTVTFDGRTSFDPEGEALRYEWDFGDKSTHVGNQPEDATPTHTYAADGAYTVTLTVVDPNGERSAPATTTATIGNIAPQVNAGVDISTTPNTEVMVRALFSDPGLDDAAWSYSIDWGDGSELTTGSLPTQDAVGGTHTYTAPNTYSVTVRVKDKDAGEGSDVLIVEVTDQATGTYVLTGAGDIAQCDGARMSEKTAKILKATPGTVFTLGDNAYPDGTAQEYRDCYGPGWGDPSIKARTFAVLGNHDYNTPGAGPSFDYFGAAVGPRGKGYYSYDLGSWHVIVLNNDNDELVPSSRGSEQFEWYKADLARSAATSRCTIVMAHQPYVYSSSTVDGDGIRPRNKPIWEEAYKWGAELILTGDLHRYERFRPQTPEAEPDDVYGIRQFIVGTGGGGTSMPGTIREHSEVVSAAHGVLRLTLEPSKYTWKFIAVEGQTFTDEGSGSCHDPKPSEPVNQAPQANADAYVVEEDNTLAVTSTISAIGISGVLANDVDADGDALTAVLRSGSGPSNGTLQLNSVGTFTYTPTLNFNGTDQFTYEASDGKGGVAAATVTITVTAVNDAPVANDDAGYSVAENQTLTTDVASSVLRNDTDVEGTQLTAVLVQGPASGTLTLNAAGSFTYTPNANFNGTDSFQYRASDGTLGSNTATATISVAAVNNAAVAINDPGYSVAEDQTLTTAAAASVLANDSDSDGDPLEASLVEGPASAATLSFALNTDGTFSYAPGADFTGIVTFTYRATTADGTSSNVATVTITVTSVNDAPVADAQSVATAEDASVSVVLTGSDVDGDALTFSIATPPAHGSLAAAASPGTYTYTPNANYSGPDSFTYQAGDGALQSNVATVTITIGALNDGPVAQPQTVTTAEDMPATVTLAGEDPEGNPLSYRITTQPSHGTLSGDGNVFIYTAAANYFGNDAFSFVVNDGAEDSPEATVSVTVSPVNDAPMANTQSVATAEDTPRAVTVTGGDPDGDALTFLIVTPPEHGSLAAAASPGTYTYTPAANFTGSDEFTFTASDGTSASAPATVTITVGEANDAPLASNDAYSTGEDTPLTVAAAGVLANDSDVDAGTTLRAVLATGPVNGTVDLTADGSLVYTPNADFNGTDNFTYRASDGALQSALATVTITVGPSNDAPVADGDGYSTAEDQQLTVAVPGVLQNDRDADGDGLSATLINGPTNGTLAFTADGSFTYTPNANYTGSDGFTYQAGDGVLQSNVATVTITIGVLNDAPVADAQSVGTAEDTPVSVVLTGSDVDGDALTFSITTPPADGSLTAAASPGTFTYTPNPNFYGTDEFAYQAADGNGGTATATVAITVNAINDAPAATDDPGYSVPEDQTLTTTTVMGVLANDTDIDDAQLTATVVTPPAFGSLTLNADGSFTYTPNADFNGIDAFEYRASDGRLTSNNATVTIAVGAANDAPVTADDAFDVVEDTPRTLSVLANDSDTEANPLTPELVDGQGPANGTISLNAGGTFIYTPNADFNGSDGFSYTVSDGNAISNAARVTITVAAVNDAPVAQPQPVTTDEDRAVTITLAGQDVENSQLAYSITAQPTHGTLSGGGNVVTYTPDANYLGPDAFSFAVNDGTEDSAPASVSITVRGVNDIPIPTADQYAVGEDGVLTVGEGQSILGNDSDADGDALTASLVVNQGPSSGTLDLNPDGTFTYTPNADFRGTDGFTYRASDGNGGTASTTVTITVTAVNDAPAVDPIADQTRPEGTPITFTAAATDPDADAITFSLIGAPAGASIDVATGAFTWTPSEPQGPATYTFAVQATDNATPALTAERQVTITVTEANAAPILASIGDKSVLWGNTLTFIATATDTDEPANALTFSLVDQPAGATMNVSTGAFSWTPGATQGGDTYTFTVRVSDGGLNADEQITVTVINPAPSASSMSKTSSPAQANAPDFELEVSGEGFAPTSAVQWNGANLATTFVSTSKLTAVVPGSRIATAGTHYVRVFNGAPGGGVSDKLAFFVTDAPAPVSSSSVGTSDDPTGTAQAMTAADSPTDATVEAIATGTGTVAVARYANNPGGTPSFATVGLWFDVNVEEGSSFSEVQISFCNVADGTLVQWWNGSTGAWQPVEPAAQLSGACLSLTVTGSSKPSLSDLRGDYFGIGKIVNTAPQAVNDAATVAEDGSKTIHVLSNDVDAEGDALSTTIVDGPDHGTVVHNADGSFSYTPAAHFNGTDVLTYRASDGKLTSNTATVTITVTAVNDAPTAAANSYNADEDKQLMVAAPGLLANDTDLDGQQLSAVLVSGPANGTLALNGDGSFTYTPNLHFSGNDAFSYRASDGLASSDAVSVAITVRPRMTVLLDIIPGSSTNSIGYSTSQTEIVLAVLSTATFDATLVDPATVTLGNDLGTDTPLAKNADGSFKFFLVDVNGDGRRDFYAYVNKAAMKANGDLTLTTTSMTVLGRLKAPRTELFRGKDKVTVVP